MHFVKKNMRTTLLVIKDTLLITIFSMCISLIIMGIFCREQENKVTLFFGFTELIAPYFLYFRFYKKEKVGLKKLIMRAFNFLPFTIINGVLIKPLRLVVRDIIQIFEILQELWGWAIIGILIASVWVIINNPKYGRAKQVYDWFNFGKK